MPPSACCTPCHPRSAEPHGHTALRLVRDGFEAVAYGRYEIALVLSVINFATLRFMNPFKTQMKKS